jgi:predicted PurR-regulated permease PerM
MAESENRQEPPFPSPSQGAEPAEATPASLPAGEWAAFPNQFARLFFAAVTLLVLYYAYAILKPFLVDIFLAFVLFITAKPLYEGFNRLFFGRKVLASGATCLLLTLLILIPFLAMAGIIANQALELSAVIQDGLKNDHFWQWIDTRAAMVKAYLVRLNLPLPPEQVQLDNIVKTALVKVSEFIYTNALGIIKGFAFFLFDAALVLLVAFFMFLRGDDFVAELKKLSPLDNAHNNEILGEMEATIKATMWSTVVVAVVQGALGGVAFWVAGLPHPAFWGTVMIPASVIPVVGAALIWVPGALYLFIQGHLTAAVGLTLFFLLIVGTVDNVLRPLLTKGTRPTPAIFILFAILGGISYFGILGFILGPLILSFLLSLLQIYRKTILSPAFAAAAPEPEKKGPNAPHGDGS